MDASFPLPRGRRAHGAQRAGAAIAAVAFLVAALLPATGHAADVPPPNIVLVLADDLGYGDLACYGAPDIRTPVLDKLATQGVRFTQFYANAPECSPTRTALLTGRYQHRVGGLECAIGVGNVGRYDDAIRLANQHALGLPPSESTLLSLLGNAGYATALTGKWHLGYEPKYFPSRHGLDHFFGILGGNADYFFHCEASGLYTLYHNDNPVHRSGHMTDLITDDAIEFIRRRRDKPFFIDISYTAPHSPYQLPTDKPEKLTPADQWNRGSRQTYAGMVEHMDQGIGRILATLDELRLAENTVVIFASDNGADPRGRNAPFSGRKSGLFEGGIRVPCIVRWPGKLRAGSVADNVCITMDLSASIARIARAVLPAGRPFDGIDILADLQANRAPRRRTLFWRARRGERTWRAVRDGDRKYISRQDGDEIQEYVFDLARDPAEKTNLLAQRPVLAQQLKAQLEAWQREVQPSR